MFLCCNEYYWSYLGGTLQNCCVPTIESKSVVCEAIRTAIVCEAKEILIVDDNCSVLSDCYAKWFSVCTPLHIVNYVNGLTDDKKALEREDKIMKREIYLPDYVTKEWRSAVKKLLNKLGAAYKKISQF